jgi:uncharacterized protein YicC (UPF0701 family)
MTGFARHATSFSGGTLTWELRAVNHRYLEPSFRLPEVVRNIEGDLRDALKAQLVRGKIECHLKFDADTDGRTIHLNADAMRDVHRVIQEMSSLLETELTPDPHELLRMPGITDTESVDATAAAAAAMAQSSSRRCGHVSATSNRSSTTSGPTCRRLIDASLSGCNRASQTSTSMLIRVDWNRRSPSRCKKLTLTRNSTGWTPTCKKRRRALARLAASVDASTS